MTVLRGLVRRWRVIVATALAIDVGCLAFGPMLFAYIADAVLAFLLACLLGLMALSITRQICQVRQVVRTPDYTAIARMERDVWGEAFEHAGAPQRFPIASPKDLAEAKRLLGPMPPGVTMAEFAEGMRGLSESYRRTTCATGHPARPVANGMCPRCERERRYLMGEK